MSQATAVAAAPVTSAFEQQVAYVTGVNADGTIQSNSWWGQRSDTAHKWGTPTAGTGATISYTFDAASNFTDTEKDTFVTALDMWSAIANVTFVLGDSNADVKLQRGGTGSGANESGPSTQGSGSTLGQSSGQHIINMETGKVGWDLSGRVDYIGGFGMATIIHEVGHLLGLGHGGNYNGTVNPATQQFSAYDELMWTTMSYIGFSQRSTAAFRDSYDYKDTNWGTDSNDLPGPNNAYNRTAHTWMPLDVVAIQRLYGEAESTPLDGGEVFGFNSNIGGRLQRFFDFTNNATPVVTLFSTGTNNTLDLSGFSQASKVDLDDGKFSSAAGLVNNIGIAFGTVIETAITGAGADTIAGNAADNMLDGGAGADTFDGRGGSDTVTYERSTAAVDIDLGRQETRRPSGGDAQGDVLVSIENLIGSNFNDRLVGLTVAGGSDLDGLGGDDILFGGDDTDVLRGGQGADRLAGNAGDDTLFGADSNLIINGGFEVVDTVEVDANGYVQYLDSLDSWGLLSGPGRELFTAAVVGADPFEGKYGIDLEGYAPGTNISITQKVDRAEDGASYRLAFEARKLDAGTSARLEVYWGGTKLTWGPTHDTYIDPTTGYLTYYIDVTGGAGTGPDKNRLTFVEIGGSDGDGTMLDNVRMYRVEAGIAKAADQDPWTDGNDTFAPGAGSDVVFGHGGNDRATFSDLNSAADHFDGGSGTDTLVLDWSLATTSIGYSGLGIANSDKIGIAENYQRTVVGGSNQYLFFKEVERFDVKGGSAGDILVGGALNDILTGNDGDDLLIGGGGVDILNGGGGFDRASLSLSGGANNIILKNLMGSGSVTLADGTQLVSIEALSLTAGNGDDYLDVRGTVTNPSDNPYLNRTWTYFAGQGGNDTLAVDFATSYGVEFDGGEGTRDLLIMDWSTSQRDIFRDGGDGSYKSFSHSVTVITGGVPYTTEYYYTASFQNVERFDLAGGKGNDGLFGGALDDTLRTNGGRDVLAAGAGDDLLVVDWSQIDRSLWTYDSVGNGSVPLTGSLATGYSGIYFGDDWRYYNRVDFSGIERFDIKSADRDDGIRTGDGDDTVSSAGGNDHIITGQGIDIVDGGAGADRWEADKSFATSAQAIDIDLNLTGVQLTYLGGATVRGIEMLTLKTGAADDTVLTYATVLSNTSTHGFDDGIETNAGNDAVTVTGGRDSVAMGTGTDTLTVDWSLIGRSVGTYNSSGTGGVVLTGSLETGYSGIYFGDDWRYYNRLDFSGVEHFIVRSGGGNDGIRTGDGNDTVISGDGGDHLITGKGIDVIDGGLGADRWEADKSFATSAQAINIDLNQAGVQLTYMGGATVRGIEMLTLKTGAAADTVRTYATVLSNTSTHGFDDQIDTADGNDAVTVTGGRDIVAMGAGADTLTIDWSLIGRSMGTYDVNGTGGVVLTGSLEAGYSGIYFGDDWRYYNRLDFSGVEHFIIRSGSGHDGIRTGDGNDTVSSGDGNDHLATGKGIDVIDGGLGADRWEADKSTATASQAINIDLTKTGVQLTYFGTATVRGIEALTLKTGAGNDRVKTVDTLLSLSASHGYDDQIDTGGGNDVVTVTGGRDAVAMGTESDTLTVDWSTINRNVGTALTGSLETGYSGFYFGDDPRYYNRVDFSGVEHFVIRTGNGHDGITTGDGNDTVDSGDGNDTVLAGGGDDVLKGGLGADVLDGGAGVDTADYSEKKVSVSVTLNGATNSSVTVNGVVEDTIRNIENVTGGSGTDTLTGDALANMLAGGADNDVLKGGLGADVLDGGAGVDMADYSDKTASVSVTLNGAANAVVKVDGVAEDVLRNIERVTGGSGADTLTGDSLANLLVGGDGDDLLKGGAGRDVLDGGAGMDTADYGDKTVSVLVTLSGATNAAVRIDGIIEDTIRDIENVMGGSGADTLTGDSRDNIFRGGLGADMLNGGAGVDTADYSEKKVSVSVTLNGATNSSVTVNGVVEDTIRNIENVTGGSGTDTLTGDALANMLAGGADNDMLKGGLGADVLDGGAGVDMADYSDKTASVSVTLNGAENALVTVDGVVEDTIRNIERVTGGSGADALTGDSLANLLVGGDGDDVLNGGMGADVLDGGVGMDMADYGDKAVSVSVTLNGAANAVVRVDGVVEDVLRNIEKVTGGSGADTLTGDAQDNVFRGGLGADVLNGGAGVDTADYGDKTDSVAVTLNGASAASVTVGGVAEDTLRNIENLTGGSGNDTLTGDGLANRLEGGAGDDVLKGGGGADALHGGAGVDTFVFGTALHATNLDTILDFTSGIDRIALDDSIFAAFAGQSTVASSALYIGGAAHDADDRLIYDSASGTLMYDSDGAGVGTAQAFAVLSAGLSLTEHDFLIV